MGRRDRQRKEALVEKDKKEAKKDKCGMTEEDRRGSRNDASRKKVEQRS